MPSKPGLRIALCGSAGVGKTSLALALSEALKIPRLDEEMREYLEQTRRPLAGLASEEVARILLTMWQSRAAKERSTASFVADNSCLDFTAYALYYGCLGELAPTADAVPALLGEPLEHLKQYDAIFLLPWGALPYVRDGVRPSDPYLQLRYQLIIEGLLRRYADPRQVHCLPQGCTEPEARRAWVLSVLEKIQRRPASTQGLLVVYTGHGKGKTTAALGIVFRALGRGLRVAVVQFIKGKWKTGEKLFAETIPDLTFLVMGKGFTWESDDITRDRNAAVEAWTKAKALIASGEYDVVVLDEITYAINYGFIELADVLATLRDRPAHLHTVLTGRNAPEELCGLADLVTEMKSVRHPFERGLKAQPGIDY